MQCIDYKSEVDRRAMKVLSSIQTRIGSFVYSHDVDDDDVRYVVCWLLFDRWFLIIFPYHFVGFIPSSIQKQVDYLNELKVSLLCSGLQ